MNNKIFTLYFTLLFCVQGAVAQTSVSDSIFFNDQSAAIAANARIDYRGKFISVSLSKKEKSQIDFSRISHFKKADGRYYEQIPVNGLPELLVLFIRGKFSLLYQEKENLFYVQVNDSLKVISNEYVKLALPVIFGQQKMDAFFLETNVSPNYSIKYLKKLVTFVNGEEGGEQVVYEKSLGEFKTSFYIGPYVAFGLNMTSFDLQTLGQVGGTATPENYFRTEYYKNYTLPVGLQFAVELTRNFKIEVNSYATRNKLKNFSMDNVGSYFVMNVPSYTLFKKFDTILSAKNYSYNAWNFDFALHYSFARNSQTKVRPYVMAGPNVAFMSRTEITLSAKFNNSENSVSTIQRWYKSDNDDLMVALSLGGGVHYNLSKHFILNVFAKYQQGVYPKIHMAQKLLGEQNDTPVPSNNFGAFGSRFEHRYYLYSRMMVVGTSLLYKF